MQKIIAVLWPSFIVAGLATILSFAFFDPRDLAASAGYSGVSRMAVYSIAFLCFWGFAILSSLLTLYFDRPLPRIKDEIGGRAQ
jgi:hypothetical protein